MISIQFRLCLHCVCRDDVVTLRYQNCWLFTLTSVLDWYSQIRLISCVVIIQCLAVNLHFHLHIISHTSVLVVDTFT